MEFNPILDFFEQINFDIFGENKINAKKRVNERANLGDRTPDLIMI